MCNTKNTTSFVKLKVKDFLDTKLFLKWPIFLGKHHTRLGAPN